MLDGLKVKGLTDNKQDISQRCVRRAEHYLESFV